MVCVCVCELLSLRMWRWMCGITKMDSIRKEIIRGTTKVGETSKKVQERRPKWYGHDIEGMRICGEKE